MRLVIGDRRKEYHLLRAQSSITLLFVGMRLTFPPLGLAMVVWGPAIWTMQLQPSRFSFSVTREMTPTVFSQIEHTSTDGTYIPMKGLHLTATFTFMAVPPDYR